MPTLATELRNKLERVVIEARDVAEAGAYAALKALAVHEPRALPSHDAKPSRISRNHLRARARQLGDRQDSSGRLAIDHLAGECAYEHWHRMLFARFLAENSLLIEPKENMAISLAEAEELAKEEGVDVWAFASRCAQRMLPQIFRPDDPLLQVAFATEHMLKLESLLDSLPQAVFIASDALGWVYQFWQSKKKDEVNRSEVKIGADEIAAVTQLFTEPYMVEFLLHNTLGAWWAGKKLAAEDAAAQRPKTNCGASSPCPEWLGISALCPRRGRQRRAMAAGRRHVRWLAEEPQRRSKLLDPCCGSGHFLVAALHHLVPIRMAEEGLSAAEAVDAVSATTCTGWRSTSGAARLPRSPWRSRPGLTRTPAAIELLPDLHIACTGIGPQSTAGRVGKAR